MQATLSPALETALEYHLNVLAIAINYGGPVLLQFKNQLLLTIGSAFQAPSWKVLKMLPTNPLFIHFMYYVRLTNFLLDIMK